MAHPHSTSMRPPALGPPRRGVGIAGAVVTAAAAAPLLGIALSIRLPSMLPAVAALSIALAAVGALLAWGFGLGRDREGATLWDLAGALAMVGCAAAMLSQPEDVVQFVFGLTMTSQ